MPDGHDIERFGSRFDERPAQHIQPLLATNAVTCCSGSIPSMSLSCATSHVRSENLSHSMGVRVMSA